MIRLITCQLKQLLPFVLLWVALAAMFYGIEFGTKRIDELSYLDWCADYCDVGSDFDLVLFTIILYMLAAYSLFPREFDEGTIDFIRSLPLTNAQIFFSKVIAAWLLISLLVIAETALHAAFLSFNTQSITGTKYWANDAMMMIRDILFALVVVSHGVFISWFRTVGLILYCGYLIGLIWLEQASGASGAFSIFRFFNNEYDGSQLLIDWPVITAQVAFAVLLLFISYVLWSRKESKPAATSSNRFARYLPALASVAAFLVLTATLGGMMLTALNDNQRDNILQLSTDKYRFAYRRSDEGRMLELAQYADADYRRLSELLGLSDPPDVHADMTSQSTHALGVASYNKIRMVLSAGESVNPVYRRVLSHETAHVLQTIISNRLLGFAGNSVGFFIEGMAQYTSFALVPDPPTQTTNWAISSVSWERNDITFSALANRAAFEAVYDPELLYGIGDIWVAAMVDQCGEQSLGDFLRSVGKRGAPRSLTGATFWRHHLNQINCSLDDVNHRWRGIMQEIIDDGHGGAFPVYKNVALNVRDEVLVVSARAEHADGAPRPVRYLIRVANETKVANTVSAIRPGKYTDHDGYTDVEFSVPLQALEGRRFSFQIGFVPFPDSRYYFEKWRSGAVP